MQRDRGESRALARVPPDELARQVLRLRRAPSVADREQAAAGQEDLLGRRLDAGARRGAVIGTRWLGD